MYNCYTGHTGSIHVKRFGTLNKCNCIDEKAKFQAKAEVSKAKGLSPTHFNGEVHPVRQRTGVKGYLL